MLLFEWTILLLLGAVILSGIANWLRVPYPALLAVGGAAVALIPAAPHLTFDPQLALALFVAPVLLDAAYDTSLKELKENWRPVGALVLIAVTVTTLAVAVVAHWLTPTLPWAAAIALGAIVAPPDAAAATAVLRQVRLPHRLLVILEGESLLNDASALLIYRVAVLAAVTGTFSGPMVVPKMAFVVLGSLAAGAGSAWIFMRCIRRVRQIPSSIILQFVSTFGVWILAERVGLSGILTVVAYGITVARGSPQQMSARLRVPSYAVWETVVFVLNVLAFLLIGLQLGPIWGGLTSARRLSYAGVATAVLVTTILARIATVTSYRLASTVKLRRYGRGELWAAVRPVVPGGIIVSWCGMRGIVTLAAALALPDGRSGPAFPGRDLIIVCAFAVVVGTLTLQGFTLRPLLALLNETDDDPVAREFDHARRRTLEAALGVLRLDPSPEARSIQREYEDALHHAAGAADGRLPDRLAGDGLRRRAVAASRLALADLRTTGEIGDAAFHQLEERLDWLELSAGGQTMGA